MMLEKKKKTLFINHIDIDLNILGNLIFIPTTNIDGTGGCEITNDYGEL